MINQKQANKLEDEKMRIDLQNDNKPIGEPTDEQENKYDAWKEKGQLGIEIKVYLDDICIAAKTSYDFEGAEENLGKLRRDYEKNKPKK